MWKIIVLFYALIVNVESHTLIEVRRSIKLRTSEIQAVINNVSEAYDFRGFDHIARNVRIQTLTASDFFTQLQIHLNQIKDIFDKENYDMVAKKLWEYTTRVRKWVVQLAQTNLFKPNDVESIRFEETFDYCIMTYLFDSDTTILFNVDKILSAIHYFQVLRYIRFPETSYTVSDNIKEETNFVNYSTTFYRDMDPAQVDEILNSEYPTETVVEQLRIIRRKIVNLSKRFCSPAEPSIVNKNLIRDRKILNPSSKFIRSILSYESIDIEYNIFDYPSNHSLYLLASWAIDKEKSEMNDLNTVVIYPEKQTATLVRKRNEVTKIMKTTDTLNTLLGSLKTNDRYPFGNAIQYRNIAAEVLVFVSTKLGYRILRGLTLAFESACNEGSASSKIPLTLDTIYLIRSQLLQFQFYRGKMIDTMKLRLFRTPRDVYDSDYYRGLHETLPRILRLTRVVASSVQTFLANNCGAIVENLQVAGRSVHGQYFDETKFKQFYLADTVRYMCEIFDYYALHT